MRSEWRIHSPHRIDSQKWRDWSQKQHSGQYASWEKRCQKKCSPSPEYRANRQFHSESELIQFSKWDISKKEKANPLLHFFFGHSEISQSVKCESSLISPYASRRFDYAQNSSWNFLWTNSIRIQPTSKFRSEIAQRCAICVRIAIEDEHFLKNNIIFCSWRELTNMNSLIIANADEGFRSQPIRVDISWIWAGMVSQGVQVFRPTVLFLPSILRCLAGKFPEDCMNVSEYRQRNWTLVSQWEIERYGEENLEDTSEFSSTFDWISIGQRVFRLREKSLWTGWEGITDCPFFYKWREGE